MAHGIEKMFSTREKPWHNLGTIVQEAPTSRDAIRLGGLDWLVTQEPLFTAGGKEAPILANVRNSDGEILGTVGDRYQILQNAEAFAIADFFAGQGAKYETAGSLFGGRKVWLLMKAEEFEILDDKFDDYFLLSNSHDGSSTLKVATTPVRVVCNNTLTLALSKNPRVFNIRHTGQILEKSVQAGKFLGLSAKYREELKDEAEALATAKVSPAEVAKFIANLFDAHAAQTARAKTNFLERMDALTARMAAPDLANFTGTKWQILQAVSDLEFHEEPLRRTSNFEERRLDFAIEGAPLLAKAQKLLAAV